MLVKKHTPYFKSQPPFFDSFLLKDFIGSHTSQHTEANLPAVNVLVDPNAFVVEVAAPGLQKENFNIAFDKDLLTVSYQEQKQSEETKEQYLMREFNARSFSRSFTFPKGVVHDEEISAQYTDGVLRLTLPKREEAKPKQARQIEVA